MFSVSGYSVPLSHVRKYVGKVVNNGECASGVQEIFKDYYNDWILGKTSSWNKGTKVVGNNITPGTAIASFDSHGSYSSHTAIYVSQNSDGVQVYDQWQGRKFGKRTLRSSYSGPNGASNHPGYFYVIA